MPPLSNQRHELFAQGLASGKSADAAYKDAGYMASPSSRASASRLLTNDNIKARVAELQNRAAEGVQISRQWVIERLVENVERAMQAEAVKDNQGKATGEYRYDGSVANRALELLGKEIGMFVDRSENVNTNYALSDELPTEDEWERERATEH